MPHNKVNWGTSILVRRHRIGAVGAVLGILSLATALAGCGMPSLGGLLGPKPATPIASGELSQESLLTAAKSDEGDASGAASALMACPQFAVWPSTQTLTAYEPGHDGDGLAIVHRGEITQTARECQIQGGHVSIKYGFSGRVLLGPKGVAGHISLPVNIVLTDATKQRVQGDSLRVEVDVAPDKPIGYFSSVRTITFDVPEGGRTADYKLYVAFEKAAGGA
jgi:hypothetical protein